MEKISHITDQNLVESPVLSLQKVKLVNFGILSIFSVQIFCKNYSHKQFWLTAGRHNISLRSNVQQVVYKSYPMLVHSIRYQHTRKRCQKTRTTYPSKLTTSFL